MVGLNAPRPPQKLIHVDVDASVIGKNYPAEVSIVADARVGLQALLEEVQKQEGLPSRWPYEELHEMRGWQAQWLQEHAPNQCEIIRRLQSVLTDDTILVSGVTNVGYWSHFAYQARQPRCYLTSSYFATLGYGFPVALGAKVACPERPVVALSGDGGFMYALPDLATAVQYNLGVVVLVFVDDALGASKNDQLSRYQGRVVGTDLYNPSFADVANVFGARGVRVEPEHLDTALQEALAAEGPSVIEVPVPTRVPPFQVAPRTR
jgi:acetolactate synthase-1/2/3 large subunit